MRIGQTVSVTGEVEKNMLEIKALGFDTVDVQLADIQQPWYRDEAEMERICTRVRKAAEAAGMKFAGVLTGTTTREEFEKYPRESISETVVDFYRTFL